MATEFIRKIVLATLLCVAIAYPAGAQQGPQALFDQANEQLESGNYHDALSLYRTLENQQTISGALFLNMGIAYHRIDSLGKAKYYLLKASRFDETEERATKAVEFVNQQFSRQSAVLPQFPWDAAVDWLRHNIGSNVLLLTGLILLNLGVLIFISHWFFRWYPHYQRIVGLSAIILSLVIITSSFYTDYVSNRYSKAVMVTEKIPVLEQPTSEATLVSQAFEGYTFTVDHYQSRSHQGWAYVRMSNGLYGWIPSSEILIL